VARSVTVFTNDPTRPKLPLILEAVVLSSVHILPNESAMLANHRPEARRAAWIVRKELTEKGELSISDVTASVDWIGLDARKVEAQQQAEGPIPAAEAGDWIIEMRLIDGAQDYHRSQQSVRFRTGLPRQPEIEVPVLVDLRPPVNLSTDRLVLSAGTEDGTAEQTVLLSVRRGLDPAGLTVETRPEGLLVELEPSGRAGFKAHVRFDGAILADGRIIFHHGDEKLTLPVIVRAR